nr:hypothetical protein [uncultured Mediterranean phage uvMED]
MSTRTGKTGDFKARLTPDHMEDILRRIDERYNPPVNIDWQPIATVPRDGTVIDLWHKDGFRLCDKFWAGTKGGWSGWGDAEVTHWKPITNPKIKN